MEDEPVRLSSRAGPIGIIEAAGIDGRYAGGRNDYHTFGTFLLKLAQKSSFTGSGFACQKKMSACAFDELPRKR